MTSTQYGPGDEVIYQGQVWKIRQVRRMKSGPSYCVSRWTEDGVYDSRTGVKDAHLAPVGG